MSEFNELIGIYPQRSIGGFEATVTIDEEATDELEITAHPAQTGADITDHAYRKPTELKINIMHGGTDTPLNEVYQQLLDMQAKAEPMDVVTGKKSYKSMLIESVKQTTDVNTENVLSVELALREVILVSLEVVTVPERQKQKEPGTTDAKKKRGRKQATKKNGDGKQSQQLESAMYVLSGGK